jgi:hypothetical protein
VFSFAMHVIGPKMVTALGYDSTSWAYQVKGMLKHTTELVGWMFLAIGVAAGIRFPLHLRNVRATRR